MGYADHTRSSFASISSTASHMGRRSDDGWSRHARRDARRVLRPNLPRRVAAAVGAADEHGAPTVTVAPTFTHRRACRRPTDDPATTISLHLEVAHGRRARRDPRHRALHTPAAGGLGQVLLEVEEHRAADGHRRHQAAHPVERGSTSSRRASTRSSTTTSSARTACASRARWPTCRRS